MIANLSLWWIAGWLAAVPFGVRPPVSLPAVIPHDFHVVYGRMGIEGAVVQVRLRFFHDDLEVGLRYFAEDASISLDVDTASDSLVTTYVNRHFVVRAAGQGSSDEALAASAALTGTIVASGEELDGQEAVWWYVFDYTAPQPVAELLVDDRLLMEAYGDQRNILRVQHFPTEKQQTYYLTDDASAARFSVE